MAAFHPFLPYSTHDVGGRDTPARHRRYGAMFAKLCLAGMCGLSAILVACSPSAPPTSRNVPRTWTPPIFLKGEESKGIPYPHIGRATEGRLSVTDEGCVYVEAVQELLIIWPADAVYDRRRRTFQTPRSGELRFGMKLTFAGTPVQPLKVTEVGGVKIPQSCQRMLVLLVAPDGARKL